MKLTSSKVQYCYDLMDAAYDAHQIRTLSKLDLIFTRDGYVAEGCDAR